MRIKLTSLAAVTFAAGVALTVAATGTRSTAQAPLPSITVGPVVPTDIPGGAPGAKLTQAATFAWQEFIALNWPAVPQNAAPNTRDTPDVTCLFDDPKCATRQRVWETFRSKLEIFPGNSKSPPGYGKTAPSFGYDAPPQYNYSVPVNPCAGQPTMQPTAWINLDESNQITVDSMYAGKGPTSSPGNSAPQLIRFLTKANRTEYVYVAQNGWWSYLAPAAKAATLAYLVANNADPTPAPAGTNATTVSLLYQTIEMKAVGESSRPWRLRRDAFTRRTRATTNSSPTSGRRAGVKGRSASSHCT